MQQYGHSYDENKFYGIELYKKFYASVVYQKRQGEGGDLMVEERGLTTRPVPYNLFPRTVGPTSNIASEKKD